MERLAKTTAVREHIATICALLVVLLTTFAAVDARAGLPQQIEKMVQDHPSADSDRFRGDWENSATDRVRQFNRRAAAMNKLRPAEGSPKFITVTAALELLRDDANGLAYGVEKADQFLVEMAKDPRNVALYIEFQPRPGRTPAGFVFIPIPKDQMFGQAVAFSAFLDFYRPSRAQRPKSVRAGEPVRLVPLAEKDAETAKFLAMTYSDSCGKSTQIAAALRARHAKKTVVIYTIPVDHELVKNNAGRLPKRMGTPMLMQVEDGAVTAFQTFGNVDRTTSLAVARAAGEKVEPLQAKLSGRELKESPVVTMYGIVEAVDVSGEDVRGINLDDGVVFSSNFRNVDLGDASLKGARIYNSDFTGADIDRETMGDVIWVDSICPDGEPSDVESLSCQRK